MNNSRETFGPTLKQRRESQGLALKTIADTTKIQESLLAALERGDVSRWPGGIVRRGFIRAYATAVGISPETLVAEFTRLFPENPESSDPVPTTSVPSSPLRLTLELGGPQPVVDLLRQLCIATVDLGLVLLLSGLAAFFLDSSMWLTLGVIGLSYWTIGTVLRGQSLGGALWNYGERRRPQTQPTAPIELEAPEFPHLVVSEGQRISVGGSVSVDGERARSARKASA